MPASLNLPRGLFRVWIVFSVVWIVWIGSSSFQAIETEFARGDKRPSAEAHWVPLLCEAPVRGIEGTDYIKNRYACWYEFAVFRRNYPEYADIDDKVLTARLYERSELLGPWERVLNALILALAPPLTALLLSGALYWAFRGFRKGTMA